MSPSFSDPTGGLSTHDAALDARNETIKIWINGELLPRPEAKVSVYDSGFLLGDGMWEGLRLHGGVWPFLDEHLDRLFDSCKAVKLDIGMTQADVRAALGRFTPRADAAEIAQWRQDENLLFHEGRLITADALPPNTFAAERTS